MRQLLLGAAMAACATQPAFAIELEAPLEAASAAPALDHAAAAPDGHRLAPLDTPAGIDAVVAAIDLELDLFMTDSAFAASGGRIETMSVMGNAIMDVPIQSGVFDLYLGAGVGAIEIDVDGETWLPAVDERSWVFGWQAMAGAEVALGKGPWSLFGEWRYQTAMDAKFGAEGLNYSRHNVTGGVRLGF